MVPEVGRTGGSKEFHYTKRDWEKIENTDTHSTREFKKSYHDWRKRRGRSHTSGQPHNSALTFDVTTIVYFLLLIALFLTAWKWNSIKELVQPTPQTIPVASEVKSYITHSPGNACQHDVGSDVWKSYCEKLCERHNQTYEQSECDSEEKLNCICLNQIGPTDGMPQEQSPNLRTFPPLKGEGSEQNVQTDDFSKSGELHWDHMPLTYSFKTECRERLVGLIDLAFSKIKNETDGVVSFVEVSQNEDISIYCEEDLGINPLTDPLATAYCEKAVDNELLISHATINLYGQGFVCNTGYPTMEVHEILHTFGFRHNPQYNSIMYPYTSDTSRSCDTTKIDKEYVLCLQSIYSNGKVQYNCSKTPTISGVSEPEPCGGSHYDCGSWYGVEGTEYCCPEPNMEIWKGDCRKKCERGYVRGFDSRCYEECGTGGYCPSGSWCNEQEMCETTT